MSLEDVGEASLTPLLTIVGPPSSPTPMRIIPIENLFEDSELPCAYGVTIIDSTVALD